MGLYYFFAIIFALVMSVACYKIVEDKGYTNLGTWALLGFLFGLIPLIVAIAKPNLKQLSQDAKADTPADQLLKYKGLLDQGIITEEEFERKKASLL